MRHLIRIDSIIELDSVLGTSSWLSCGSRLNFVVALYAVATPPLALAVVDDLVVTTLLV